MSSTIDSDEAGLQRALDERPADHALRLILADIYDERGEHAAAEALRWMAAKGRYPGRSRAAGEEGKWSWWSYVSPLHEVSRRPALLPGPMWPHMPQARWAYPSRAQAERVVVLAWAAMPPAARDHCRAWDPDA